MVLTISDTQITNSIVINYEEFLKIDTLLLKENINFSVIPAFIFYTKSVIIINVIIIVLIKMNF